MTNHGFLILSSTQSVYNPTQPESNEGPTQSVYNPTQPESNEGPWAKLILKPITANTEIHTS
jgi:hypothetical protein